MVVVCMKHKCSIIYSCFWNWSCGKNVRAFGGGTLKGIWGLHYVQRVTYQEFAFLRLNGIRLKVKVQGLVWCWDQFRLLTPVFQSKLCRMNYQLSRHQPVSVCLTSHMSQLHTCYVWTHVLHVSLKTLTRPNARCRVPSNPPRVPEAATGWFDARAPPRTCCFIHIPPAHYLHTITPYLIPVALNAGEKRKIKADLA